MSSSTAFTASRPHPLFRAAPAMLFALAALALAQLAAGPARGQDRNLLERVERLQRELVTLQSYVYRGETPPAGAATATLGAEGGPQAARAELRLSQLEQELRALTGQIEQQNFRIEQLAQRLDRLVADVDDRLLRLESGAVAAPAGEASEAGGETAAEAAPGTIGTVSESDVAAVASPGAQLPPGSAQEQYDHAFALLSRTRYDEAAGAFGAFLEQHPDDALAGNAKYWLGETYYVQGQYADAAVTFAEGYQAYPDSPKAPDNLLKLGKSLSALGQNEDACGTFDELIKRYGSASPNVINQAKAERKRLSCP